MPLTNHFTQAKDCELVVWKISESEKSLLNKLSLTTAQQEALSTRKTAQGRQGYLAVRLALVNLGVAMDQLVVSPEGIPLLPNAFCSLSHSQDYAAAVCAKGNLGVDIEAYRPKIERIAPKFVHQNEVKFLSHLENIKGLTRLWTAKEAVYKALKTAGLSFSEQIEIMPFDLIATTGTAKVYLRNDPCTVQLQFSTFDQHELTIAHNIKYASID